MKEEVQRKGDRAFLPHQVVRGQNIVKRGRECRSGSLVLTEGVTVSPIAIAAFASFGLRSVRVVAPPSIAVITTGDEIAVGNAAPNAVQVRNSNGPMIVAQARAYPLASIAVTHANDSIDSLAAALDQTKGADIVALTGGVSVGIRDLVPAALAEYGTSEVFHKVAQKPGKPLLFAKRKGQLFFGLPGKPAGCYLCFHRYVAAALRKKLGRDPFVPVGRGRLVQDMGEQSDRVLFVPSRVTWQARHWNVECLAHRKTAGIFPILSANAYTVFRPNAPRCAGDEVTFELMQPTP
jgi:molybdopterin molybdotransferase